MSRNSSKQAQAKGGFTLVELVVVIAVLAILAGVGAVAYNGYIEYAKKGVDRKTVGEIIHAIELANYDDPSLFENGATVYITKDGVKSGNTEVDAALARALGELSTVKLTSENWKLADISKFPALASLGENGSKLDDYYDEVESTGKKAIFADDVGGLWDAVVKSKEDFGSTKDNYLQLAINYLKNHVDGEGNPTGGIAEWNSGGRMEPGAEQAQAISLARNYCFAAYAAKQNLSDDMKAELQKFIDDNYGMYGTFQPTSTDKFFWDYFRKNQTEWQTIIDNYNSNQAQIDAKAYMGMMEAVEAVGGAEKKDDELMEIMEQYVGVVAAGIDSRAALTYALHINGEYATINVTKQAERVVVNPGDLDPRDENGTDINTTDGDDGTCSLDHTDNLYAMLTQGSSFYVSLGNRTGNEKATTIELCLKDKSKPSTCTINASSDYFKSVKVEIVGTTDVISVSAENTITALKSGVATVKITGTLTDDYSKLVPSYIPSIEISTEFTVNVHGN